MTKLFKKILIIAFALCLVLGLSGILVACTETPVEEPAHTQHVDNDHDGKCDVCSEAMPKEDNKNDDDKKNDDTTGGDDCKCEQCADDCACKDCDGTDCNCHGNGGTPTPTPSENALLFEETLWGDYYDASKEVTLHVTSYGVFLEEQEVELVEHDYDWNYTVKVGETDYAFYLNTMGGIAFGMYTFDFEVSYFFEPVNPGAVCMVTVSYNEAMGTVTLNPEKDFYKANEQVTLTVVAEEGYKLVSVTLNEEPIQLTDGSYTFTVTDTYNLIYVGFSIDGNPEAIRGDWANIADATDVISIGADSVSWGDKNITLVSVESEDYGYGIIYQVTLDNDGETISLEINEDATAFLLVLDNEYYVYAKDKAQYYCTPGKFKAIELSSLELIISVDESFNCSILLAGTTLELYGDNGSYYTYYDNAIWAVNLASDNYIRVEELVWGGGRTYSFIRQDKMEDIYVHAAFVGTWTGSDGSTLTIDEHGVTTWDVGTFQILAEKFDYYPYLTVLLTYGGNTKLDEVYLGIYSDPLTYEYTYNTLYFTIDFEDESSLTFTRVYNALALDAQYYGTYTVSQDAYTYYNTIVVSASGVKIGSSFDSVDNYYTIYLISNAAGYYDVFYGAGQYFQLSLQSTGIMLVDSEWNNYWYEKDGATSDTDYTLTVAVDSAYEKWVDVVRNGNTITVTITLESGYVLDLITLNGEGIFPDIDGGNVYTFTLTMNSTLALTIRDENAEGGDCGCGEACDGETCNCVECNGSECNCPSCDHTIATPTLEWSANGAEGNAPEDVTIGNENEGYCDITLPENTYTVPSGKYFRGWEINEVVYFPGEKYTAAVDSTVSIKAIWEDLAGKKTVEIARLSAWNGEKQSRGFILAENKTVVLKGEYAEDLDPGIWAGYVAKFYDAAQNYTYMFRPDGIAGWLPSWTGANQSNAVNAATGVPSEEDYYNAKKDYRSTYTWTYANGAIKLKIEVGSYTIEMSTKNNLTASSYELYPATDGATAKNLTIEYYDEISAQQTASESNPIEIGTPDNKLGYTGMSPRWTSTLKKGETLTLTGTMTASAAENYDVPIMYAMDCEVPTFSFRMDGYKIQDNAQYAHSGWTAESTKEGNTVVEVDGNWDNGAKQIHKQCDIELTFDFTGENLILIFKATGTDEAATENFGKLYMCTWTIGGITASELKVGLGGEHNYCRLTGLARTSEKEA